MVTYSPRDVSWARESSQQSPGASPRAACPPTACPPVATSRRRPILPMRSAVTARPRLVIRDEHPVIPVPVLSGWRYEIGQPVIPSDRSTASATYGSPARCSSPASAMAACTRCRPTSVRTRSGRGPRPPVSPWTGRDAPAGAGVHREADSASDGEMKTSYCWPTASAAASAPRVYTTCSTRVSTTSVVRPESPRFGTTSGST